MLDSATQQLVPSTLVYAKEIPGKGRGVFARRPIRNGELIESCPVIVCPGQEWEHLEKTALRDFYLNFGPDDSAICLGFGSLYNHSETPNAKTVRAPEQRFVHFYATRDIAQDEEICFRYECGAWFTIV
jgi:SET domain-containing protein